MIHVGRPVILGIAPSRRPSPRSAVRGVLPPAVALILLAAAVVPVGAQDPSGSTEPGTAHSGTDMPRSVVVTTEVLGSVVRDLVGDGATVHVLMEGGADPHTWQPSARDSEELFEADLVIANGLGLEEGLVTILEQAESEGVTIFEATDHVAGRDPAATEPDATHEGDPADADHEHAAGDPHFWLDPLAMRDVVVALVPVLADAGIAVDARATGIVTALEALDAELAAILAVVPGERRTLVTGHQSLGYFADRYGFTIVGTVIPGLTTSGEPSARDLAELIDEIRGRGVPAIFTEVGTPAAVADAVAAESGARIVELRDAQLPEDGSYPTLLRDIARSVADALVGA